MTTTPLGSPADVGARPELSGARSPREPWGWIAASLIVLVWAASVRLGFTAGVAVLTALAFGGAVVGLARPTVGLVSVTLLCVLDAPARVFLLGGGLFRWNTLNYWLVLVAALALPRLTPLRDGPTRLLQLFALLLGAEILISTDLELGLQHLINLLATFGLLAYFAAAGTRRAPWYWAGFLGGTAGAAGGLAYFLQRSDLVVMNPNAWAYLPLGALLTICLGFSQTADRPRRQLVLGGLAAVNATWVFLSGSRGALLVALCCVGYLFAVTPGLGRRATVGLTAGLVLLGASALFTSLQDVALARVLKLVTSSGSLSNRTSGRFDLMLGGFYIFLDHPFGVGTGGFATAWANLGPHENLSSFERGQKFPAHAGWIKTLAENGIPGVLLLAAFVLSFVVTALGVRDRRTRRLGYLAAVALATAWVSTEFQAKSLWLLAAGTATLLRTHRFPNGGRRERTPAAVTPEVSDDGAC